MSRKRYRYDRDLERLIEIREEGNYFEESKGPAIIKDIEPYRAIASDIACDGKRPVINSRSDHRAFLRRNGYVEVGNERPIAPSNAPSFREQRLERANDIRRAMGDFGSNVRDR